jgi:glycogen(starch) synthase
MQLSIIELDKNGIRYCGDPNNFDGAKLHLTHCEIEKSGLFHSNKIIHVSQAYKNRFDNLYPDFSKKSAVMPNGVDLTNWSSKKTDVNSGKVKICYIGRYASMKGINIILDSHIPDNIDFYFVGNEKGSDSNLFAKMLQKCNTHENVHYVGALFDKQKEEFLNAMDYVVMPSTHEPFGIVALEAFASKSCLITTATDGLSDFCNEKNSILIQKTSESLSNVLNNLDKYDKNALISNAIETVKKYSWDNSSKILDDIYKIHIK